MNYVIGGTLATFIGSSVLTHLIDGTIGIIYSGALFARHGTESNKVIQKIRIQIEELDIKIKLELVQKLLETLEKNDINDILEEGLIELMIKIKSVKVCGMEVNVIEAAALPSVVVAIGV